MVINELSGEIAKLFGVGELYAQSTDKGKSLWGGAFQKAGSGFQPLTFPAKAVGKGIQYGTTARYQGLGAAAKQMYGDAKGTLGKTPLGDFAKATGAPDAVHSFESGIKGFKARPDYLKRKQEEHEKHLLEKGQTDAIKNARKESLQDYKNAAHMLGKDDTVKNMDKTISSIKAGETFQKIESSQAILDKYKNVEDKYQDIARIQAKLDRFKGKTRLKGKEKTAYQNAKAEMDKYSKDEIEDFKKNREAYETAKKYMAERNAWDLKHHTYEKQMVDAAEIYKQSEKQRKKELTEDTKKRQEEAVARQTAKTQAKKDSKK